MHWLKFGNQNQTHYHTSTFIYRSAPFKEALNQKALNEKIV